MEIYQWLLRHNVDKVLNTGYFVYCNGKTDSDKFDAKLEFVFTLISYEGNDSWVEDTVYKIHKCLSGDTIPEAAEDCDYCMYIEEVSKVAKSA